VLFEFVVNPIAPNTDIMTILNGSLKISITARPTPVPPIRLNLKREIRTDPTPEPPPTRILSALSRLTLYRMQERARNAADAGQFDTAARQLQALATSLLSKGEHALAKTALLEANSLEKMHVWSASGNKDVKYSTRALLLGGSAKEKQK
jgi:Ca-activated chloride channel family protein